MKYAFLIAAPHSGSGKTTLARGLMALFTQQSLRVQPFKCGPDYIDTKFHEEVCQRPSINLDTFMATEEHVRDLFGRYTQGGDEAPAWAREPADMAIVEGMMGLFDGYDHDRGSCGEIARMLALPIVLVVDARSAAYSMAALLQGFIRFRAGMRFAGVIFNKVGSPRHEAMLREVADEVGIACLGCIPRQAALEQASRYLGLDFSERTFINKITATLSAHIDCKRLLEESRLQPSENEPMSVGPRTYVHSATNLCSSAYEHRSVVNATEITSPATYRSILVARNAESFSFIYQETLDLLHQLGEVEFFDPEDRTDDERRMTNDERQMANDEWQMTNDERRTSNKCYPIQLKENLIRHSSLDIRHSQRPFVTRHSSFPSDTLLYLPGGYPEKHLEALMRAEHTRRAIRDFAEAGGRIIAECGGMMYLCREIITDEGTFPMCGVLPYSITARQADRRLALGYRQFALDGHEFRGHEFHYTRFVEPLPCSIAQVCDARQRPVPTPVIRYKNVIASYTHLAPTALLRLADELLGCNHD